MNEIFNHLWQSTAFTAAIAIACVALRRNSPRLRYWLWLTASAKFLIPFSLLVSTGARIQLPPDTPSLHAATVQQITTYLAPLPAFPAVESAHAKFQWPLIVIAIWLTGASFLLLRWFRRWRTVHLAASHATRLRLPISVQAFESPAMMEPGVFGIFSPMLLLPAGIADNLSPSQFEAVIAHELRHIRYRDNLTAALHMSVETLFWFHPLVWWIGARLMEERERDCDEAVLTQGSQPGDYARGIVQVCEAYIRSPLPCASGISGSDLKRRIREIMTWRGSLPMTLRAKAILAAAGLAAVSIPFAVGILRAQTLPPPPAYTYDVVSIHPSAPGATSQTWDTGPRNGLKTSNYTTLGLLMLAYQAPHYQFVGLPGWASSNRYDIILTPAEPEIAETTSYTDAEMARRNRSWQRLQAVLRDRFGLVLRTETRQLPVYALVKAQNRIIPPRTDSQQSSFVGHGRGHLMATAEPIGRLAAFLSGELGRAVIDETGFTGQYDYKLDWTPDLTPTASDPSDPSSTPGTDPSIFTALQDQLGLRLQAKKGPVVVYVVEKIHPPSDN